MYVAQYLERPHSALVQNEGPAVCLRLSQHWIGIKFERIDGIGDRSCCSKRNAIDRGELVGISNSNPRFWAAGHAWENGSWSMRTKHEDSTLQYSIELSARSFSHLFWERWLYLTHAFDLTTCGGYAIAQQ